MLTEYLSGVEPCEHVETPKRGKARFPYTYRWLCDLPLRDGEARLLPTAAVQPDDMVPGMKDLGAL